MKGDKRITSVQELLDLFGFTVDEELPRAKDSKSRFFIVPVIPDCIGVKINRAEESAQCRYREEIFEVREMRFGNRSLYFWEQVK